MQKKMMMLTTTAYMSERFNRDNIMILENMGYEVHVVANFDKGNPSTREVLDDFRKWVEAHHGKCYSISIMAHPSDQKNFWKAYHECMDLIEKNHYQFIHCHTPVAGVLGRILGHKTHTKVIYTAHGFHFFKGAPKKNWILFYPVEKFLSKWTDVLITINHEDYDRAKKKFHAKETVYIPGVGVDFSKFRFDKDERIEARKKFLEEENIPNDAVVFLSVGELHPRKNHRTAIKAFAGLKNPNIYYLIAGTGSLKQEYEELIKETHSEKNIRLLGYRADTTLLYEAVDCYIHPSVREGLGIAPIEAMACGLPIIAADVNGMRDYTKDGVTGCCVDPTEISSVQQAILKMYSDMEFRNRCAKNCIEAVKPYDIRNTSKIMKSVYNSI